MSRGPGLNPREDLLHLWREGTIKDESLHVAHMMITFESVVRQKPPEVVPVLSKVKMSPSHLAALLGVLGSELQLERRRVFLRGELVSSAATSNSGNNRQRRSVAVVSTVLPLLRHGYTD